MRNAKGWIWLAGAALVGALVWGLEQTAISPLETGEAYPPYSTLRADPLGAKALYESLADQPGITVERLYKQRTALEHPRDAMFILGVDPVAWSAMKEDTFDEYEKLIQGGGRLVIAFLPARTPYAIPKQRPVEDKWKITLRYRGQPGDDDASMPRASALYFEAGPEWTVKNSVAWRNFGAGTIVLAADTFPLSNEGLVERRAAPLIAALVGPARRVIFDENHFGVTETGSVTKLMRKYDLEGAVAVLVAAAILFLWRSASSLLPPRRTTGAGNVAGRDSLEGMTALLHRGLHEKNLLDACFAEWSKSARKDGRAARVEQEIRRAGKSDPVGAYRAACRIASEKL